MRIERGLEEAVQCLAVIADQALRSIPPRVAAPDAALTLEESAELG